jgi:hypothetical protein
VNRLKTPPDLLTSVTDAHTTNGAEARAVQFIEIIADVQASNNSGEDAEADFAI